MKRSRFCCTDNFQGRDRSCWLEASPKKREDLVMQFGSVFISVYKSQQCTCFSYENVLNRTDYVLSWLVMHEIMAAKYIVQFLLSQRYTVNNNSCLDFPSQDCVCFVNAFGLYPPSVGRKMPFWLKWTPPPLLNSKQEIEYACFS